MACEVVCNGARMHLGVIAGCGTGADAGTRACTGNEGGSGGESPNRPRSGETRGWPRRGANGTRNGEMTSGCGGAPFGATGSGGRSIGRGDGGGSCAGLRGKSTRADRSGRQKSDGQLNVHVHAKQLQSTPTEQSATSRQRRTKQRTGKALRRRTVAWVCPGGQESRHAASVAHHCTIVDEVLMGRKPKLL